MLLHVRNIVSVWSDRQWCVKYIEAKKIVAVEEIFLFAGGTTI